MAKIIRIITSIGWLAITALMLFIVFNVIQTEPDQQVVWSWIVVSALVFLSASFLAYVVIFQNPRVNIRDIGKN